MTPETDSFAALLREVLRPGAHWEAREMGEILTHLLDTPVGLCVAGAGEHEQCVPLRAALCGDGASLVTIELIKDFAKQCRADPGQFLPDCVAAAIYFAAIATGLTQYAAVLSTMDAASLRAGMTWINGQAWVDPELRVLLDRGLTALASAG